jgi:hypothetical protein
LLSADSRRTSATSFAGNIVKISDEAERQICPAELIDDPDGHRLWIGQTKPDGRGTSISKPGERCPTMPEMT